MECQEGANGSENWTIGNQSTDLFANVFPFMFLDFFERVGSDVESVGSAYALASEDTVDFLIGYLGDSALTRGIQAITSNISGANFALPSDWLGNNVSMIIGGSYLLSSETVGNFANQQAQDLQQAIYNHGACSFSAETLVMTEDGLVPIAKVPLYELVLFWFSVKWTRVIKNKSLLVSLSFLPK